MALVSGGRSTLNPNAPVYIPACMRQVEDFSPEWWNLVTTSTWFRDYWLSQNQGQEFFGNDEDGFADDDVVDLLPDSIDDDVLNMEAQFEEFLQYSEQENMSSPTVKGLSANGFGTNADALVKSLNFPRDKVPKYLAEPRYFEKPVKHISPKTSPRLIQQPR